MSAYKVVKCKASKKSHVIAGLLALGLTLDEIEVHDVPQSLVGYHGDKRQQKANIIVRRAHVNQKLSGGASNDIGFEEKNGEFTAHISDYDNSWWKKQEAKFSQAVDEMKIVEKAKEKGYRVTKVKEGNTIKLKLTMPF